ncbi:dienelactone hydrolase family protein [Hellea balneolensis]|uniref:dienelactone hydrolase family protein n=1 Tax=Hellea balneolensis TaxID=287478 RepID=UPI00040A7781|nr:dienelactone hydrolase family protein [Hellea balneolensis]
MKKTILISTVFLLMACGPAANDVIDVAADKSLEDIATVEASQNELDTTTQDMPTPKELPLPPFPDYPPAKTKLGTDDEGVLYYPIKSPYDFTRILNGYDALETHKGKGTLVLPEGISADEPVPAMVIMHGSGGIKEGREMDYAALFAENGIAGFVIDYYEPRGVTEDTPYVMKTMAATEVDIMSDAYSALKILSTHPAIDAKRIGVTGYSYGGMGTRYVLDKRLKDIMAPNVPAFALHMDIYGPCHQTLGYIGTTGAPYLAIHGDSDNSVDPALCQDVYKGLEAGGSQVESHVIKGAGHAWENAAPLTEFGGGFVRGCEFSFDKAGVFLVDGKSGRFQPTADMTRPQRAMVRAGLGELAGNCVGQGYTVGNNPEADKISKALQLDFMKRVFGL